MEFSCNLNQLTTIAVTIVISWYSAMDHSIKHWE